MARILVVDDEPDLRFLMRVVLQRAGHEVAEAINGESALESIGVSTYDLVVTDMLMPVMGGAELITRLRSDPTTAHLPIVAATGDAQLAGAADIVLTKPYLPGRLVTAVASLLTEAAVR